MWGRGKASDGGTWGVPDLPGLLWQLQVHARTFFPGTSYFSLTHTKKKRHQNRFGSQLQFTIVWGPVFVICFFISAYFSLFYWRLFSRVLDCCSRRWNNSNQFQTIFLFIIFLSFYDFKWANSRTFCQRHMRTKLSFNTSLHYWALDSCLYTLTYDLLDGYFTKLGAKDYPRGGRSNIKRGWRGPRVTAANLTVDITRWSACQTSSLGLLASVLLLAR